MSTFKPVVETICNNCGFRTTHSTRTRALISLTAHDMETWHDDQMFSTVRDGWTRFAPLDYSNATVN